MKIKTNIRAGAGASAGGGGGGGGAAAGGAPTDPGQNSQAKHSGVDPTPPVPVTPPAPPVVNPPLFRCQGY